MLVASGSGWMTGNPETNLLAQILTAGPWPKTTTLVEPGHRSPLNSRLSKLSCLP